MRNLCYFYYTTLHFVYQNHSERREYEYISLSGANVKLIHFLVTFRNLPPYKFKSPFSFFLLLFIYLWLCWVFVAVCGLSLIMENWGEGTTVPFRAWPSHCSGFSCRGAHGAWALGTGTSGVMARGL